MTGLIQKSGYIKPGDSAGRYMKYIATRDGVELMTDGGQRSEVYMRYIAERPRSHGLFSGAEFVNLEETMEEAEHHPGPVWTFVYSLKREDAARLGYDSADSWRRILLAHQVELAGAMKISPKDFRWCAAFHDEKHHPHIHMMVWSADPKRGYLTERGIEVMRSKLTNDIFRDELLSLYQEKDFSYREVTAAARETMSRLIRQMKSSLCDNPAIAEKMGGLVGMLENVTGKKVYGYLKKPMKAQVDSIVDELARLPEVAECYEVWNRLRDELEQYYKDKPRERQPLSRQKEFKSIKNMVIREAENIRLGVISFEDEGMEDEAEEEQKSALFFAPTMWRIAAEYRKWKAVLYGDDVAEAEKEEAVRALERLWETGFTVAAHQLGKCWRDGLGVLPDDEKAELWFRRSAEEGFDFSQYALGKLLQSKKRTAEAVAWYEKAAEQRNQYARYRLGKLYLQGESLTKDAAKAVTYLTASAEQGNQYAQYALGKLYLMGVDVKEDRAEALRLLTASAQQGNEYAQFFLDRFDQIGNPNILLSSTRLLHYMGQFFRQNSVPPAAPVGHQADRKLLAKLRQKKIAMGHKADDQEEYRGPTMSM